MKPKVQDDCFIADTARVIGEVTIGTGTSVWYGAVLRGDEASIEIGFGTNIQDNVIVHTTPTNPVKIGNNCSIGHGAVVHGCIIHDNVIIGINATILDKAEIHTGAVVGANALVLEGQVIPKKSLAVGVPAKVVREDSDELFKDAVENAMKYHELRDQHKEGFYKRYKTE